MPMRTSNPSRLLVLFLVIAATASSACDHGTRIARLEKQNDELRAELKTQVEQSRASSQFDMQGKCAKDAKVWFDANWPADKETQLLHFQNHYNAKENRCFIVVEYHYGPNFLPAGSWINDTSLWDVYENAKYGQFTEQHVIQFKPTPSSHEDVTQCEVAGTKCKSLDEFNALTEPYMNN